jgi:DNA adenine methylase
MSYAGLEALAGRGGTSPAKASSPCCFFSLSTIHYPLSTMTTLPTPAKPFLKWAGGKSQLIEQLKKKYPPELEEGLLTNYYEPFLGGGAIFFDIIQNYPVNNAYLSDINEELILVYQVVQNDVSSLIDLLQNYQQHYLSLDADERTAYFYEIRESYNQSRFHLNYKKRSDTWTARAAQMIFLNKTGYNGLFRLNQKGAFNVPFGQYKKPKIADAPNLLAVSKLLQRTDIRVADFGELKQRIAKDSFVYLDPPYRPISKTANFTTYSKITFDEHEQIRLAKTFRALHKKGIRLMLSNSDPQNINPADNFFERHYAGFNIATVAAHRMINSVAQKRGRINELVITNYDLPH